MNNTRSIIKYLIETETNVKEPSKWDKIKKHIKKNKNKYGTGIAAATNIASTAMIWKALNDMKKRIPENA